MPSKKILTPIIPGATYHIFNRGVNFENVFIQETDYQLFLDNLKFYLNPVADIFAYVLIPNHYHLLLRIKEKTEIGEFSHQFKRFILSYTNAINVRENRSGNLFLNMFKRLRVSEQEYLLVLVFYIHYNPQKHGVTDDFRTYTYSSYKAILSKSTTLLERQEVVSWFGDIENFISYHESLRSEEFCNNLIME